MPVIGPDYTNGTVQTPSWVRVPPPTRKASEVPWRKNLKSGATPAVNNQKVSQSQPQPEAQQPKTTKLQINLKSVKKPEAPAPTQTDKLPPVQLNPVLPENKTTTNKPPTGKTIPITIQKAETPSKTVPTTTIPIQRPHNDPPPNKPATAKAEGKAKKGKQAATTQDASGSPAKMPPAPPPAPPLPPGAPPPPPPPPGGLNASRPPKPPKVTARIEQLKKAPRRRPDWANMMKEIEQGQKLKHVQCNDRSKPILPKMKSRGKFVFESEAKPATKSDALHNRLLNEIQSGVKLKRVQCNDRSKPILSGLRVRRQSSVADTDIQKVANSIPEEQEELAFVMDIDVLRDELQSAKQMLEMEIESKHNVEKKSRDQKCQIIAMEAEIETLKAKLGLIPEEEVSMLARGLDKSDSRTFKHLRKSGSGLWKSPSIVGIKKSKSGITKDLLPKAPVEGKPDQQQNEEELNEVNELEEEISSLKQSVQHARKQAEEMEKKYKEAMEKLLVAQGTLEDSDQKRRVLEKKVETLQSQNGNKPTPVVQTAERTTQTEEQILERMLNRQQSTRDDEYSGSEEEDSDVEVDEETVQRKKQEREIKLWENKLKSMKEKQHSSRLERKNLKILQKKLEVELKEAKKRHKKLQKEVDKMAKMLKEAGAEDDEEDDEEKEPEVEEEEEEEEEEEDESEEESESESEEEEEESSEEDDEDATHDDRLGLFGKRIKRRENVLNALRKGNYLLRANIDRLKDDLEEARIAYHDLEHELSSCVDDL